jgi:hypothetical protein
MLPELQHAMGRRRRIRIASQAGAGALLAVVSLAMWSWIPAPAIPDRSRPVVAEATRPIQSAGAEVTIVRTDASIVERLRPSPTLGRVSRITDAQLREELSAAGLEPGFIRTQGRVLLAKDLAPESPEPRGFRPSAEESTVRG